MPVGSVQPTVEQEQGTDVSSYLQAEAIPEQSANTAVAPSQAPLQRVGPQLAQNVAQTLNVDTLTFQIEDDEVLNEQFERNLLDHIDRMQADMDDDSDEQNADDVDVQIVIGSTVSLTAGIVSWVLRGGSLLASLMSTVPLLNRFDPLPILKNREDEEDVEPDDDSDDSGEKEHARRVENMFSGKQTRQPGSGSLDE